MSLSLAFQSGKRDHWWDALVAWRTMSDVTHVELQFSDGVCFSAHPADKYTRFKVQDTSGWTIVPLQQVSPGGEAQVRAWCKAHEGIPYGWESIWAMAANLPKAPNLQHTMVCSEICKLALQHLGILAGTTPSGMTDPETLLKEIRAWNAALAWHAGTA
jgi:hypothetical protein